MSYRSFVVVVILALPFVQGCGGSGPGATLQRIWLAGTAGKYSDVDADCCDRLKGLSKETWELATMNGTVQKVEIVKEETKGETATVAYRVHFKDGTKVDVTDTMIIENGKWKLTSFSAFLMMMKDHPERFYLKSKPN
jgi:Domain of unknown function (DUF4878)